MALQAATSTQCELIHEMQPGRAATSGAGPLSEDLGDSLSLLIRCSVHLTVNTAAFWLCNNDKGNGLRSSHTPAGFSPSHNPFLRKCIVTRETNLGALTQVHVVMGIHYLCFLCEVCRPHEILSILRRTVPVLLTLRSPVLTKHIGA